MGEEFLWLDQRPTKGSESKLGLRYWTLQANLPHLALWFQPRFSATFEGGRCKGMQ